MTSRRAFLAQSGFLAAGLLTPSLAHACWRRRRSACCAPVVVPQPCEWCGEVHEGRPRMMGAPGPDGLQNCAWICPRDFFGQLNGIFYYYCICCPNNTCCVNGCDSSPHDLCTDCSGSGCFLIGGPPSPFPAPIGPPIPRPEEQEEPAVQMPASAPTGPACRGNFFHASQVTRNNGITTALGVAANFTPGPNAKQVRAFNVKYDDGARTRNVRLFDLVFFQGPFAGQELHAGQEITTPQSTVFELADAKKGHHHTIRERGMPGSNCYHVLIVR